MTIVARFFPNGEFSHGFDTSQKRRHKHRRDELPPQRLDKERRDEYLQWRHDNDAICATDFVHTCGSVYSSSSGHKYTLLKCEKNGCTLGFTDTVGKEHQMVLNKSIHTIMWEWRLTLLVYQSVESCEKPENRKKLLSMSKSMSRNIRNAVYLLEQEPGGKDVLSFLTLTLPGISKQGLETCCINWDSMVKRFFDWLRMRLKKHNMQLQHVYCTEIQSKRLQSKGEYAPHLHVVFRGRDGKRKPWVISAKEARKAWGDCIRAFVSERFSTSALENLQRIKYSAARYLSKYLSKGGNIIPSGADSTPVQSLKTQWGGMARNLSRAIRKATTRIGGTAKGARMVLCILANMENLVRCGLVRYYKEGFIPLGICETTGLEYGLRVGCGCLQSPTYTGGLIPILEYCYQECFDML